MKQNLCAIIGTGWLGLPLGEKLTQEGNRVIAATRKPEKFQEIEDKGMRPFLIDFSSPNVKLYLQDEIDSITHLYFTIPPTGFEDYAQSLLSIAQQFPNLKKVVFASSTGVYQEIDAWVNENSDVNEHHPVFKAEQALSGFLGDKLIVLRLSGLIGPNRHPAKYFLNKRILENGNVPVNLIQLEDILSAFSIVSDDSIKGEIFNLSWPEHPSKSDYYSLAAKELYNENIQFSNNGVGKVIDGSKIVENTNFCYNKSIFDWNY